MREGLSPPEPASETEEGPRAEEGGRLEKLETALRWMRILPWSLQKVGKLNPRRSSLGPLREEGRWFTT